MFIIFFGWSIEGQGIGMCHPTKRNNTHDISYSYITYSRICRNHTECLEDWRIEDKDIITAPWKQILEKMQNSISRYFKDGRSISSWFLKLLAGWWLFAEPLWKMMEWKSVGMIFPFPTWWESHSKFHGSSHHQSVGWSWGLLYDWPGLPASALRSQPSPLFAGELLSFLMLNTETKRLGNQTSYMLRFSWKKTCHDLSMEIWRITISTVETWCVDLSSHLRLALLHRQGMEAGTCTECTVTTLQGGRPPVIRCYKLVYGHHEKIYAVNNP